MIPIATASPTSPSGPALTAAAANSSSDMGSGVGEAPSSTTTEMKEKGDSSRPDLRRRAASPALRPSVRSARRPATTESRVALLGHWLLEIGKRHRIVFIAQ